MSNESSDGQSSRQQQPTIIVQMPPQPGFFRSWFTRVLVSLLMMSAMLNLVLLSSHASIPGKYDEEFVSGDEYTKDTIAIISISGTIMPPFTERTIEMLELASKDDDIKGVILSIDSPGGFVADSHQIYRQIKKLAAKKPIYVSMKRMAASGGVYVAMGVGEKGKLFAEPTTWTGSIGVIIPRYDASKLAEKIGVSADALKTGEFKDSLDPLKSLSDKERKLWGRILDDSLQRFTKIVADNRKGIDNEQVKGLATGQIFTAEEAKSNGLVDEIGDEDVAIEALKTKLDVKAARVVEYDFPTTFMDLLWGVADSRNPETQFRKTLEMSVPRAMYFFGNAPALAPLWQAVVE